MTNHRIITSTDNLRLEDAGDGRFNAIIRGSQEITDEFLSELSDIRTENNQRFRKTQDNVLRAAVPVTVIDHWIRQGFNPLTDKNITNAMVVARLRAEGLDAFVTS